jgi:hypothetical protein
MSQRALADMAAWVQELDRDRTEFLNSSSPVDAAAQR